MLKCSYKFILTPVTRAQKEYHMPSGNYPEHDINQVFDYMHSILIQGDSADNSLDELDFVNRLFAALPAQGVEYGMQFLHGKRDLPKNCDEIMPLFIRFVNLVEYCETIEKLRDIPTNPTTEQLMERIKMNSSLDELEKPFCKPLLGFAFNKELPNDGIDPDKIDSSAAEGGSGSESDAGSEGADADAKKGNGLHLMNGCAPVFVCKDPLQTSCFYEKYLGFESTHLDDETMPHIRLSRDNIDIVLVAAKNGQEIKPMRELCGIDYDLYIYVSEPMMLQMELANNGVAIIKQLGDAETFTGVNREFVFGDIDGRHICVSQRSVD